MRITSSDMGVEQANRFFFRLHLLLLATVFAGFAPTFFLQPTLVRASFPTHLIVHGVLLTLWFCWVAWQVAVLRMGRPRLHRITGTAGFAIGAAVVYAGPLATMGSIERLRARGLKWTSNMSEYPALGIESATLEQYARGLVWGNFGSALTFALCLAGAVYWRRVPAIHKRLISLASIAYMPPAFARISRLPYLGGEDGAFIPLCMLALLAALVLHDRRTLGRVHRATALGIALSLAIGLGALLVSLTPFGQAFVRGLA
jgi:hypothetical protein